jgi:hypothetical protein
MCLKTKLNKYEIRIPACLARMPSDSKTPLGGGNATRLLLEGTSCQVAGRSKSLAQTWPARAEFYNFCILSIMAPKAYSNHVAPGQAETNSKFEIQITKTTRMVFKIILFKIL